MMAALSTFFCDHLCIVWSFIMKSRWKVHKQSTYICFCFGSDDSVLHAPCTLPSCGSRFFFCMSLRTPFSQKLMLLDNNHLKPRGCDVFEGGAIDDGFTGSGNTLLPSTLPVNPSGLAAFLILIFLKR